MNPEEIAREKIAEMPTASGRGIQDGKAERITGRKPAKEALHESEERFRAIFELAAVGVAQVAKDGGWLDVNQRLCDIVGYTREELLRRTFQDITHPDDLDADLACVRQMLAGEISTYAMEKRYIRKGGGIVWIALTVSLVRETSGAPKYFISVVEDITARKCAEDALRESEARYRRIVDTSEEGIWMIDAVQRTSFVNPKMARMLGYSVEEMMGRDLHGFMDEEGRAISDANVKRRAQGIAEQHDFKFLRKDGSALWALLSTNPIRDADGAYTGALAMITDITERKRAEDELHRLSHRLLQAEDGERRRIAKELHDSTAQDLVAVIMNLGALHESLAPGNPKAARILADSIALVENSVNDIRTLSYVLHPPRLDETGLAGALAEYAAGFTTRTDTRIRVEIAPDFGRLPEDMEIVLFRVVQEGIANVLRHAGSDTATIRLVRDEENVVLEIEDYGRGMADAGARGVGISGMRERLQHLGGRLEMESDSGGTIVRAVLPLRENRK